MTTQRLTLYVPDPSVHTSMNLGAKWNLPPLVPDVAARGTQWNGDGFCVNSHGRIWLDAGGEAATSTFGALSNAPAADTTAGLLVQSLKDWVYSISAESNITSSNGSILLAGGSGIKIIAGHGAPILPYGISSHGSGTLQRVGPSSTTSTSEYASTYTDYLEEVAKGWAITDTVVAGALTVLDVGITVAGCVRDKKWPGVNMGTFLTVMGSAANLAGMGVNIGGMEGGDTPGVQIHASANVNFATTGFCSVHSGAGLLLFGLVTAGLGFITAGITGFANVALKSCLMSGIEGSDVSITAGGKDLEVSAKTTKLVCTAVDLQVGTHDFADTFFAKTQMRTMTLKAEAAKSVTIESQAVDFLSKGSAQLEGGTVWLTSKALVSIVDPAGTYKITVQATGIKIEAGTAGASIQLTPDKAVFRPAPGGHSVQVDSTGILMGGATANVQVGASGAKVNGQVTLL